MRSLAALVFTACAWTSPAGAQAPEPPGVPAHDMMQSAFGPYSMHRDASGTSWQPEAAPMAGLMQELGGWSVMVHGIANLVYDDQGGARGDRKTFTNSMLMAMASRPAGPGSLGLRAMLSLDPTIGRGGYPLLFQSGESADGQTTLVDRQHPHDAFMELSGSYAVAFAERGAAFVYAGLPGEPALGPPTFMHRFSGMRNPEAPLTHHWLDSTHVTMGVATLGASYGAWKVEGSYFNGREPDQNRWNIETRPFDSSSARITFNPADAWSLQVSRGRLASPEALEPDLEVTRTTASVLYQSRIGERRWGATLAWGRNVKREQGESRTLDGWLLESTIEASERDTFFGRVEHVRNDELFGPDHPLHGQAFPVGKLTLGYIRELAKTGPVAWSVGILGSVFQVPAEIRPYYGDRPGAYMVFVQARI